MSFEGYKQKDSVVIVYTGEGKGKTSAALGLMGRALGFRYRVAFIQFVKYWHTSEHDFIARIQEQYGKDLYFYKGGKGFYNAGALSAAQVTETEHKQAALETYQQATECSTNGNFDLVICDEINNAVHDGLLKEVDLKKLITKRHHATNLCLTGRNFPNKLLNLADIATNMTKLKHHFDDKFLASKGIDY